MTQDEMWLLKEKWHGEKTEGFFSDCARLRANEPLAYIIGYVPFLTTTILLDTHPLIPRTETEYWVSRLLTEIKAHDTTNTNVLDLCAGSGCIGVGVLSATKNIHVDFAEIDTTHHVTIQKNVTENHISEDRTHVYGGDLFEKITKAYSYILANPPYIDPLVDRTEPSVKQYEPHKALYGGIGGMQLIQTIISEAPRHLTDDGILVIEHEPEQKEVIHRLGSTHGFFVETNVDQYGTDRYSIFKRLSQKKPASPLADK